MIEIIFMKEISEMMDPNLDSNSNKDKKILIYFFSFSLFFLYYTKFRVIECFQLTSDRRLKINKYFRISVHLARAGTVLLNKLIFCEKKINNQE